MTLLADRPAVRTPKRWTKHEYYLAVERGVITGTRVYLYHGELIQMPAMGSLHARGVSKLTPWAVRTFDPQWVVRCQLPFDMPDNTAPQPEFAIVTPEQDARLPHPNAAVLVIEVADSSIELDQAMALEYAAAGVPEYWLVNVRDRNVEIFRDPRADAGSPMGHRYFWHRIVTELDSISPLARPDVSVSVATFVKMT
jgi:Uma2 family endonuclease